MSSPQMMPMISPDGQLGDVPVNRVHEAVAQGFKIGQDMVAPDGSHGVIPMERVKDAIGKGFQLAGAPAQSPVGRNLPVAGPISRAATAFGAQAGDLLQAGASMKAGGVPGESYTSQKAADYYHRTGDWRGAVKLVTNEHIAAQPGIGQELAGAARGTAGLVTEPIQRAMQGDVAGAIGQGAANLPTIVEGARGVAKGTQAVAQSKLGQTAIEAGKGVADVGTFGQLPKLYKIAMDRIEKIRDIWREHPELAPNDEPQPNYSPKGPQRNAGAGQRDVIRPKLLPQQTGIQDAEYEPIYTQNRGLLQRAPFQQPSSTAPPTTLALPPGNIQPPAPVSRPYRLSNLGTEDVAAPNPRILAGNRGIRTTPIAMLPERGVGQSAAESAMMTEPRQAVSPTPQLGGMSDIGEDSAILDAMRADLEQHGQQARLEQGRQFAAGNAADVPKWLRNAQAKAQQVLDEAQQQAEQRSITRALAKGNVKPSKIPPKAPVGKSQPDDLTPLLQKSLDAIRKKKGNK